jgi:hypothetical protein
MGREENVSESESAVAGCDVAPMARVGVGARAWAAVLPAHHARCLGGLAARKRKIATLAEACRPAESQERLADPLQIARRLDLRHRSDFHPLQLLGHMALSGLVHESAS